MDNPMPTGETAVAIVPPRDVCGFADGYRRLYMPNAVGHVPPHVTVAGPFVPYDQLEEALPRLESALKGAGPIVVALRGFATFPESGILYLYLSHPERVLALYKKINAEFPDFPAYGGAHGDEFTPHLTVGVFEDPAELEQAYATLSELRLFIGWDVEWLTVLYKVEDGSWLSYADISIT